MKKIALFLLFLFISTSFIMVFPDAYAQAGNLPQHTEEELQNFEQITGFPKVDWQERILHSGEGQIDIDSEMFLDFEHESWTWTTSSKANSTYVVHETRSIWDGSTIQYVCKNNLEDALKCWLRGSVVGVKEYRIGVSGGMWVEELSTYYTTRYNYNLSDITDYGFPIAYDSDTNQLVIRVTGTFDIDPLVTENSESSNNQRNDVALTVGHFNYVFFKKPCDGHTCIDYVYSNASEGIWIDSLSVNRTYSANSSYVQRVGSGIAANFPHVWKTNGTHIYSAIAIQGGYCGPNPSSTCQGSNSGTGFFLFNITRAGDAHTDIGYQVGELVVHTNASIPCLGNGFGGSGICPEWKYEFNHCDDGSPSASAYRSCGLDVTMNSTGFPMVTYGSGAGVSRGNVYCDFFDASGCPSPIVVVAIAENPVDNGNAGCFPKGSFAIADKVPCDANDARNGKNGTWTTTYQVDTFDERVVNATHIGSGNRYIWWQNKFAMDSRIWEQQTCSMGNGNMLLLKHNKTASSVAQNEDSIVGRFWYQSNATWGSEFFIHNFGGGRPLMLQDDMDLTCTPNAAGVMTAHIAFTTYKYNDATNATGRVSYINFTGAEVNTESMIDVRRFDKVLNVPRWALDVQVVADNSTGAIAIYYLDNYGNLFLNATGGFGSNGFGNERALLSANQCGLTDSSPQINAPSDWGIRNALNMGPFFNGTGGETSSIFMTMSCNASAETIDYYLWQNTSISSKLMFYDQEGVPVTVTNMTFTSNYNGSTLGVFDCSSCNTALKAGTYTVTGIFRGSSDMDINGTGASPTFYIDIANTTASFIVGNMSVTFTFFDETTLDDWDVSAKPVKVDIWTTTNNKMDEITIDEVGDLQLFTSNTPARVKVTFGDTYQFYRWNVQPNGCNEEGCNTDLIFYLPDYSTHTVQAYEWTFIDSPNAFQNGTVLFRKYVSTGLIQIDHPALSVPSNEIVFYGILNDEYTISAFSQNNLRRSDIGLWTALTETKISANIEDSPLFDDLALSQRYILWDARRTICTAEDIANDQNQCHGTPFGGAAHSNVTIFWHDIKDETSQVSFEIFNSSGRVYTNTLIGTPGESIILWQGADTNISHTYWIKMTAVSSRFGTVSETRPVQQSGGGFGPMIPIGRCPTCTGSLLPVNSPFYIYISMMILIFVVGLFSQQGAAFGGILTAIVADMLYIFGWLPGISPLILGFGTLLMFLYAFAMSRG